MGTSLTFTFSFTFSTYYNSVMVSLILQGGSPLQRKENRWAFHAGRARWGHLRTLFNPGHHKNKECAQMDFKCECDCVSLHLSSPGSHASNEKLLKHSFLLIFGEKFNWKTLTHMSRLINVNAATTEQKLCERKQKKSRVER